MSKRFLIMGVLVLAVVALTACAKPKPEASTPPKATTPAPPPPQEQTGNPQFVSLQYNPGAEEGSCMTVDPEEATIYVSSKEPHNVMWKKKDSSDEWIIEKKAKDGGAGSLNGVKKFTIPCGGKLIPSANANKDGEWNYSVTVKRCEKGQPGETLCQKDPRIIILP